MVQKWGALSLVGSGKSFLDVARRPNLSREDARAIERECPSVALVDVWLGEKSPGHYDTAGGADGAVGTEWWAHRSILAITAVQISAWTRNLDGLSH